MNILIAGGTGLIGRALTKTLSIENNQIWILTRNKNIKAQKNIYYANNFSDLPQITWHQVINLAGEPIAEKRWSTKQKKLLWESRIITTRKLVAWMASLEKPVTSFLSASAVGYYGASNQCHITETSEGNKGWTHSLCDAWEKEANQANAAQIVNLRLGVVISSDGGAVKKMLPAYKLGLGGALGTGQQWFSWIAMSDVINAIQFISKTPKIRGPVNLVSPHVVKQHYFAKMLGKHLARPVWVKTPAWLIFIIFGELGETLMLSGAHIIPQKLLDAGFVFKAPSLEEAFLAEKIN